MPKEEVEKRGFSTEVVDFLKEKFPVQLNMYLDKPLREEMADVIEMLNAKVYIIDEVKEGVSDEAVLYTSYETINIEYVSLDDSLKDEAEGV